MTSFVNWLLSLIYILVSRAKGPSIVEELHVPGDLLGPPLTGHSTDGYEITIYCRKKRYRRRYERWFGSTQDLTMYQVYSTVSSDAPDALRRACELDRDFPPFHPEFISDEVQKEAAINAYLDLVADRLQSGKLFNS